MHSRRLVFFLFMFWGGGGVGKIFFHFSRLLSVFALCSFQVPNGFPIFSPTFSPYLFTFICLCPCMNLSPTHENRTRVSSSLQKQAQPPPHMMGAKLGYILSYPSFRYHIHLIFHLFFFTSVWCLGICEIYPSYKWI
jgi:hypothetical protein